MLKNRPFLRCALLAYCLLGQSLLWPTVVIFDLGGVLFETGTMGRFRIAREIGIWDLIIHKCTGGQAKMACFDFLNKAFGAQEPYNPTAPQNAWLFATGEGITLPQIWCDHMAGLLSGAQVIEQTHAVIDDYFADGREKRIIKNFISTVFNPIKLADNMRPITQGVALVNDCAARSQNTIMILSNFGTDSFDALYNKEDSRAVFDHIKDKEHLMISGAMGLIKPDPAIYAEVKRRLVAFDSRFSDPHYLVMNCIFIDDQIENVIGARQAGITALLADGNDAKLREELAILGAL